MIRYQRQTDRELHLDYFNSARANHKLHTLTLRCAKMPDGKEITFQSLCYRLVLALTPEDVAAFCQLASDRDRIVRMLHLTRAVPEAARLVPDVKSAKLAASIKDVGNSCYKQKKFQEALRAYNECLVQSPPDKQGNLIYAMSLANKGAVYFELKQYQKCVDCCLYVLDAYKSSYPKEKLFRIYGRLAKAYQHLGDCKVALKHFNLALEILKKSDLSEKDQAKENKILNQQIIDCTPPDLVSQVSPGYVNNLEKHNTHFPVAHSSVSFKSDPQQGRFAIAREQIPTGTVILKEQPFASILGAEHITSNCHYCSISCSVILTCPKCTCAVYCSELCKELATKYHNVECGVLNTLYSLKCSVNALLALRMVTMHLDGLKLENNGAAIDLCTNLVRRNIAELIPFSAMSILLVQLLRRANPDVASKNTEDDDIKIASALLLHLQQLQFNTHELFELRRDIDGSNSATSCKTVGIGAAIYPTLAMLNHSCEPNISRYNDGRDIVVRTIKPLRRGDMIYENYGPVYLHKDRAERRQVLSKYYLFECACAPCTNDWPRYDTVISRCALGCRKCGAVVYFTEANVRPVIPCERCLEPVHVMKSLGKIAKATKKQSDADSVMAAGNFLEAFKMYSAILDELGDFFDHPRADVIGIQEQLKLCIAQFGNKSDDFDII